MEKPMVSVITPTYNGESYLGKAIQSVLNQTYPNFELIIVDDGSVDDTAVVVKQFNDARIKFIPLEENRGADAARNTGIHRSSGKIIAFLDQDDIFHPEKLQVHVEYMSKHPHVGFTYNSRYELEYSSDAIKEIWAPPSKMTLADIVLSHKLSPSDMVFKKDWALHIGLLDESHNFHGGEIIFLGRLFLSGCKFGNVKRALNYRRYHSGRRYENLQAICQDEIDAQDKVLLDPRCPKKVYAMRNIAHTNMYLYFICLAFAQDETALGRKFIAKAVRLNPKILLGDPCPLVGSFLVNSIDDKNVDHELMLDKFFNQLPGELTWLLEQKKWVVARGYFEKGIRSILWGMTDDGDAYFSKLAETSFELDETFFQSLNYHLMRYKSEFGSIATENVLNMLTPHLNALGGYGSIFKLRGGYMINDAFQAYREERFVAVPLKVIKAFVYNPTYVVNRGVLSIFIRSFIKIISRLVGKVLNLAVMGNGSIITFSLFLVSSS